MLALLSGSKYAIFWSISDVGSPGPGLHTLVYSWLLILRTLNCLKREHSQRQILHGIFLYLVHHNLLIHIHRDSLSPDMIRRQLKGWQGFL